MTTRAFTFSPVSARPLTHRRCNVHAFAVSSSCQSRASLHGKASGPAPSVLGGCPTLKQQPRSKPCQTPEALPGGFDEDEDAAAVLQKPPSIFWRMMSALFYMVPWIDSISVGRFIYSRFRNLILVYLAAGPLHNIYFSSQFAPLIIFFLLFLAVVKNTKLHHFVRYNAMQAVMLDIVVMLIHILRTYLPPHVVWSPLKDWWDMITWVMCFSTILYCVFWTLRWG
ncbi:TIC20 [Auxenochlorella protothecoides x Auxenochlorella symbiontica]